MYLSWHWHVEAVASTPVTSLATHLWVMDKCTSPAVGREITSSDILEAFYHSLQGPDGVGRNEINDWEEIIEEEVKRSKEMRIND